MTPRPRRAPMPAPHAVPWYSYAVCGPAQALAFALAAAFLLAASAPAQTDVVTLAEQLHQEAEIVRRMQERLKLLEQTPAARLTPHSDTDAASANSNLPREITSDNLTLQRLTDQTQVLFTIKATNAPFLQPLEALTQVTGLRLEVHPRVSNPLLHARISLELERVSLTELLEILAGMQGLAVTADSQGILVAPVTTAAHNGIENYLRERALQTYQAALVRYPAGREAPDAYLGIARHYARKGYHAPAIQTAQNVVDKYPDSSACGRAWILIGDSQAALRRFDAARAAWYRYIDTNAGAADLPAVMLKIGAAWTNEGRWSQAIPIYESAARDWPQSEWAPVARLRLAEALMQENRLDQAIDELRAIEKLARRASFLHADDARAVLAECLTRLNKTGHARVVLKELIQTARSTDAAERAYYALGDSFLKDNEPLAALEAYRGAMSRFPKGLQRPAAPLRLLRVYLKLGLLKEAEESLNLLGDDAMALKEVRAAIVELIRARLQENSPGPALRLLADQRWPHDTDTEPDLLILRARAYLCGNNAAKAAEYAKRAVTLAREQPVREEACRIAGEAWLALNNPLRAAMAFGGTFR